MSYFDEMEMVKTGPYNTILFFWDTVVLAPGYDTKDECIAYTGELWGVFREYF